jgi:transcriptional regulator with XRE-family HTH domain
MLTIKVKGNSGLTLTRIRKGMSMNELSKKAGLNVAAISRVENGSVTPRPKTAQKICDALGAQFDEIFEIC